jgi:tetratricopeptide (TPR) repeat protein
MAKSLWGRGGPVPPIGLLPGLGAPATGQKANRPGLKWHSKAARPSADATREARRYAIDGVRLVQRGRVEEGIALLGRSIQLDPDVAAAHHDLGGALLAAGRLEEAAGALAVAIRLNPGFASAHLALAQVYDVLGAETKAMASYQAVVALRPALGAAQLRLGDLYLARGLRVEAATAFRAAASASAGTLTAQLAEARALEALDAFDEALAAMRAVVEAHPGSAIAHGMLGRLLSRSGRLAEAVAHHERAVELSPDLIGALLGLAINRKFTKNDDQLIARLAAALERPNLTASHRQTLCFALGKVHDDTGDYEAAMGYFEAGNRFRARAGGLDRDALVRRIARVLEATPPGYRDRQPNPGVEDATPILIVGMPRSGSTLVEQILSSHPDVAAGGELEFWGVRYTLGEDVCGPTSTAHSTRRLADEYLARLRALAPDAKRITDKALSNFMRLGIIHRVFPNATLIHCRRHPIDTALSIFTTNFGANLDFAASRGDLVFFFRQYQRVMAHWRKILPPDRLVEVDYEALVADPEPQARRLISACGLEWNDACLAPHRNTRKIATASVWQARQPIYRTSVERWRRYEPWLGELRKLAPEG